MLLNMMLMGTVFASFNAVEVQDGAAAAKTHVKDCFSCCRDRIYLYFVSVLNAFDRTGMPGCSQPITPNHHDLEVDHRWLEWTSLCFFSLLRFVLADTLKGFCVAAVSILGAGQRVTVFSLYLLTVSGRKWDSSNIEPQKLVTVIVCLLLLLSSS